jgi:SAM-dependent methyltransferase
MNRWDERYKTNEWVFGTNPNDFLRSVTPQLPPGRALSLGEGEGRNAVFLAERGWDVTAVDMSRVGLEKAEVLAAERGVRIQPVVADLNTYTVEPEAWDVITLIWLHMPPDLREHVHSMAAQGLRRGGAVVLEAYTPDQREYGTGGPSDRKMLYRAEMLLRDFSGLRPVICTETVREISEGAGHAGQGAVVQFLAVREG